MDEPCILINALVRYEELNYFISPNELKVPDYVTDMLKGKLFLENNSPDDLCIKLDPVYDQSPEERFFNEKTM